MSDAANLYYSYMRGFRDGAGLRAIDTRFETHPNQEIREAYAEGCRDGHLARNNASRYASRLYGYKPSVLRVQGEDDS